MKLETPVWIKFNIFSKKPFIEFFISDKKLSIDFFLDLKKRTNPFIISFNNVNKAEIAITFKASFPAFSPTCLTAPTATSFFIAFSAFFCASSILSVFASNLSWSFLLFFLIWDFFSKSDKLEFSIFLLALSFTFIKSFSLSFLFKMYSLLVFSPLLLFNDSFVGCKFSTLFASCLTLNPACFRLALSNNFFLGITWSTFILSFFWNSIPV